MRYRWTETSTSIEVLNSSAPLPPLPAAQPETEPPIPHLPVEVRMAIYRFSVLSSLSDRKRPSMRCWVTRVLGKTEHAAAQVVRNTLFTNVSVTNLNNIRLWIVAAQQANALTLYQTRSINLLAEPGINNPTVRAQARHGALLDHKLLPYRLTRLMFDVPLQNFPRLKRLLLQGSPIPLEQSDVQMVLGKTLEELVFATELSGFGTGDRIWSGGWERLSRVQLIGPRMILSPRSLECLSDVPALEHLLLAFPRLVDGWTRTEFWGKVAELMRTRKFPTLKQLTIVLHKEEGYVGHNALWVRDVERWIQLAQWKFGQYLAEEEELDELDEYHSIPHLMAQGEDASTRDLAIRLVVLHNSQDPEVRIHPGYYARYLFARAAQGGSVGFCASDDAMGAKVDQDWGFTRTIQSWTVPIRVLPVLRLPRTEPFVLPSTPESPSLRTPQFEDSAPNSEQEWRINPILLLHLSQPNQTPLPFQHPLHTVDLDQPLDGLGLGYALARMGTPRPPDPRVLDLELELS